MIWYDIIYDEITCEISSMVSNKMISIEQSSSNRRNTRIIFWTMKKNENDQETW